MENFDQTLKKAKDLFDTAYQKTGETLTVQKLKIKLSNQKNSLKKSYAILGEILYNTLADKENLSQEVKFLANEIEQKLYEINKIKDEISSISGSKTCEKCNNVNPKDAVFCTKCGEKLSR